MYKVKYTNCDNYIKTNVAIIQKCGDRDKTGTISIHDYSNTIPSNPMSDRGQLLLEEDKMSKKLAIRKLTPTECSRLMGMNDDDIIAAGNMGISNSQLYKQMGNGLVTNCISLIMEHLYKAQYDENYKPYDEVFLEEEEL